MGAAAAILQSARGEPASHAALIAGLAASRASQAALRATTPAARRSCVRREETSQRDDVAQVIAEFARGRQVSAAHEVDIGPDRIGLGDDSLARSRDLLPGAARLDARRRTAGVDRLIVKRPAGNGATRGGARLAARNADPPCRRPRRWLPSSCVTAERGEARRRRGARVRRIRRRDPAAAAVANPASCAGPAAAPVLDLAGLARATTATSSPRCARAAAVCVASRRSTTSATPSPSTI